MTVFDYLKDIVVTKRGDLSLQEYSPYMINRWLSFMNPQFSSLLNECNRQQLLEDKALHYKTVIALVPRRKHLPRFSYIKKVQEKKTEEDKRIEAMAQSLEISKREIREMMGLHSSV